MRRSILLSCLAPALLACPIRPAAAPNAQVVLKPPSTFGTDQPNMQGYSREAAFVLGTKDNYSLTCSGGRDTTDPKKPFTPGKGGACMGMPGPVATGWYCYGFLNLIVNGQEASTTMPALAVSEQGRRAMTDSTWHLDAADLRVRFLGLPGGDFLWCEVALDPKQEVKSFVLTATCFPAYFTGFYGQREQARFVQTPSQLIREAEGRGASTLTAQDNWWLLYGDEYFDVAKTRESDGPCAMLLLPESITGITVSRPAYGMTTTLTAAPTARTVRLAFWKMKGRTNAEAVEYFRKNGEPIRRQLAALDFTPESIKAFDLPGTTAEIQRIARSETVGPEFRQKATELLAWIKDGSPELAAPGDGVNASERKLQLLNKYTSFVYEARLAEILASLDK